MDPISNTLETALKSHNLELIAPFQRYFDPNMPNHKISLIKFTVEFMQHLTSIPAEKHEEFYTIFDKTLEILNKKGFREPRLYLTGQEASLTGGTIDEQQRLSPYTPNGILLGELTIEEAQKARKLSRYFNLIGDYFNQTEMVLASLEPLNNQGETIRDPRHLCPDLSFQPTSYSNHFPFKR